MTRRRFALETLALLGGLLTLVFVGNAFGQSGAPYLYLPLVLGQGVAATATQVSVTPTPVPVSLLVNGDFESGSVGWGVEGGAFISLSPTLAHSGSYYAQLSGDSKSTPRVHQRVYVEPDKAFLVYWDIALSEWSECYHDVGYVWAYLDSSTREVVAVNQDFCLSNRYGTYRRHSADLSRYAGKTIDLAFEMNVSGGLFSAWCIDDISFQSSF